MATFRNIINRVLIALGQADDQVDAAATELSDAYHIKVAEWVNDILQEVEDAAQWRVLRQRETVTISAGALSAAMTLSNERSRVFRVQNEHSGELVPLVFDVTTSSSQQRLREMDLAELLFLDQQNSNNADGGTPVAFALEPTATGMNLYVWPRPVAQRTIEADMIIPQSRLDYLDDDDLDSNIKVPAMPVVYGAVWWGLSDRGEEFGVNVDKAEKRYRDMVADAVAAENAAQGFDELVPT